MGEGAPDVEAQGRPPKADIAAIEQAQKELQLAAWKHLHKTACTAYDENTGTYKYKSVLKTSTTEVGVVTASVGIQLYFMFLKRMGVIFFLMTVISLPMLIFNCAGKMVDSANAVNKALAQASVANIGVCPPEGCLNSQQVEGRCLLADNCDDQSSQLMKTHVKDVTPWLGLLDAICVMLFLVFGVWFLHHSIPKAVRNHDKVTISLADFSVEVKVLPEKLGGSFDSPEHKAYQEKLRQHFVNVLKTLPEKERVPDDEAEKAIAAVTLVREYDGAISTFMDKGRILMTKRNEEALLEKYRATEPPVPKKVAASEKAIAKLEKQIAGFDKKLSTQASKLDEDRGVCLAFVSFMHEKYKTKVLDEYRFANYRLFRCCQHHRLRFEGHKINVVQACEPSDLYWENLDFNPYKRSARKICVLIMTLIVLIICSTCLVAVQTNKLPVSQPMYNTWAIVNQDTNTSASCLRVCDLTLFSKGSCEGGSGSDNSKTTKGDWAYPTYFDAAGPRTLSGTLGGNTTYCPVVWESPACNPTTGNSTQDWFAVSFSTEVLVKCLKFTQSSTSPVANLRIFGCVDEPVYGGNESNDTWHPTSECVKMQSVVANNVKLTSTKTTNNVKTVTVRPGISSGNLKVVPDTTCQTSDPLAFYTLSTAKKAYNNNDGVTWNCYCQQQWKLDTKFLNYPYDKTEAQRFCNDAGWYTSTYKKIAMIFGSVLAVVILNQVLLALFYFFITFERLATITECTRSQLWKLFLAQFVNTALLIYLVNCNISGGMKEIPPPFQVIEVLRIGKGPYVEADAEWFIAVGSSIVITILSQVFSTTIPPVLVAKIVAPLQRWYTRWSGTTVTEDLLFEVYVLPAWDLALRLAQSMNVICCCIMYAGGMPLMYFIGFLYCLVAFWVDKYGLLKGSRRPPAYTQDVIEVCMAFLPLAAFLHTLFACSVLGNKTIFPSDWSGVLGLAEGVFGMTKEKYDQVMADWMYADDNERGRLYNDYLNARFLDFARQGSYLLMLIFLAACAYYILIYTYSLFFGPFLSPFIFMIKDSCKKCLPKVEQSDHAQSYQECKEKAKSLGVPVSYDLKDNEAYSAAYEALKHSAGKVQENKSGVKVQDSKSSGAKENAGVTVSSPGATSSSQV